MDMISRLIRSRHCGAVRSPSQSELSVGSQWLSSAAPWAAAEGGSPGSGARPLPGPPAPPAAAAAAHTSGRKGGPNPPPLPLTPTTPATPLDPGPAAPAPAVAVAASSVGLSACPLQAHLSPLHAVAAVLAAALSPSRVARSQRLARAKRASLGKALSRTTQGAQSV